ncbi:MAG: TetR/AcrR family transcriptional regulator [Oscillospiraceae bacterium]
MKRNQTAFLKLCLADALIELMAVQDYQAINVNAICELAGVGRTTFYRHLDHKSSKEELLVFKLDYEWERYEKLHRDDVEKDKGFALASFIYENRRLFSLLYDNGLIAVIMKTCELLVSGGETWDKDFSYLISYFIYGYFGVIYQWIKYGFDETPQQIQKHISNSFSSGLSKNQHSEGGKNSL